MVHLEVQVHHMVVVVLLLARRFMERPMRVVAATDAPSLKLLHLLSKTAGKRCGLDQRHV